MFMWWQGDEALEGIERFFHYMEFICASTLAIAATALLFDVAVLTIQSSMSGDFSPLKRWFLSKIMCLDQDDEFTAPTEVCPVPYGLSPSDRPATCHRLRRRGLSEACQRTC